MPLSPEDERRGCVSVYIHIQRRETWEGCVCNRTPTQVVCDLHEQLPNAPVLHCDIKSCRYNAIAESNTPIIPIFPQKEEFTEPATYKLSDYMWVYIGPIQNLMNMYTYVGPRWHSTSECQFSLDVGVCNWYDVMLACAKTMHQSCNDMEPVWKSFAISGKQPGTTKLHRMVQQQ